MAEAPSSMRDMFSNMKHICPWAQATMVEILLRETSHNKNLCLMQRYCFRCSSSLEIFSRFFFYYYYHHFYFCREICNAWMFNQYNKRIYCVCSEELNCLVHWMFNLLCTYITEISFKKLLHLVWSKPAIKWFITLKVKESLENDLYQLHILIISSASLMFHNRLVVKGFYIVHTHTNFRNKGRRTFRILNMSNKV